MCSCKLCERNRIFDEKISTLPAELKDYFQVMYEYFSNIEFELNAAEIYLQNLKNKYPEIAKEVCTIRDISNS